MKCYVIDFGLARRHIDNAGNVFPARKRSEFRGTRNYASLDSHENRDLSRKDDLWSLFMVLADMCLGGLPWRHSGQGKNKDVLSCKRQFFAVIDQIEYQLSHRRHEKTILEEKEKFEQQEEEVDYEEDGEGSGKIIICQNQGVESNF